MTREEVSDLWFQCNQNLYAFTEAVIKNTQAKMQTEREPYGYLWFTKHMERRFTHMKPTQGFIGEIKPVFED
jgi:hypothetical protein